MFNHYATITSTAESDSTEGDFADVDLSNLDSNTRDKTVIDQYSCKIIEENISFDTGKEGVNYSGQAKMIGELTNKIKKGHIVDGIYKVVGRPKKRGMKLVCNLARL